MAKNPNSKSASAHKPVFPEQLGGEARRLWDLLLPALMAERYYKPGDELGLAIICFAYAQWLAASEMQQRYGAVMKTKNGNPIHSPYATVANQHASVVITLLKEYGFTPASRGKLPSRLIEHPDWTGLAGFELK